MLLLFLLAWSWHGMHLLRVPRALRDHSDVDDSTGSPLEPVPTYYGGPAHGPVENAARKRVERQMSTLHPSIICSHSELQRQTSLRFSPLQRTTSPFMMLSQRRACRFSPLVPTRCHYHRLRFSGRTFSADILWTPRARPFGALCILDWCLLIRGLQAWFVLRPLIGSTVRSLSS